MDILKVLQENKNDENAPKMKKYMRNKFEFLGIKKGDLKRIEKEFFKDIKKEEYIDYDFVKKCYFSVYRECQYVAIDYLINKKKYLSENDMDFIKNLIITKSWWDTSDILQKLVCHISQKEEHVKETILLWSCDNNIWLRRVSIIHQLQMKEKTDTNLLEKIIVNNLQSDEFFINKAIGWALRDYSKTNKEWVENFIEKYKDKMSKLSIKEASKYLYSF